MVLPAEIRRRRAHTAEQETKTKNLFSNEGYLALARKAARAQTRGLIVLGP